MAPVVNGLEEQYGDLVNFIVLDMDDEAYHPFTDALNYNRAYRPGLYLLGPGGEVLQVWFGVVDGAILGEAIDGALATLSQ